jgi:hypothetical protein
MQGSWARVVSSVRAQARQAYARELCLVQQMHYIQLCLFAKIWHVAQIFPLPRAQAQQLMTICSWFLWQGATFRVPATTLQRTKHEGGWSIMNIEVKCRTLLYNRITTLDARGGTVTSALMSFLYVPEAFKTPPYVPRIPYKLMFLRQYVADMAYVASCAPEETSKHFKRRVYSVLGRLAMNGGTQIDLRIVRKFPDTKLETSLDKPACQSCTGCNKVNVVFGNTGSNPHKCQAGRHQCIGHFFVLVVRQI